MTDQSDRFPHRRSVSQATAKPKARIHLVPDAEDVAALLASPPEAGRADAAFWQLEVERSIDTTIPELDHAEVAALLTEIGTKFDRTRFDRFMGDIRDSTLSAVAGPLGLGYVLSGLKAFDDGRPGGTVTHYQPGTRGMSVAIVLSAPGRYEEAAKHPAAGPTKRELQAFVSAGYASRPDVFRSPDLEDYRITNAWDQVEYKAKTGRSEATNAEVMTPANLHRLRREIGGAETVITYGDRAEEAVEGLNLPASRMHNSHPSLQAMNRKFESNKETPSEAREDRTKQWVDQTLASVTGTTPTVIERARAQASIAVESGYKMGKQQVIGAVLTEFSIAMSNEIVGCFRNGIRESDEHVLVALSHRAKRVGEQVLSKWKTIVESSVFGVISGIVAETAAIFVNMIAGISARFIRIVRQGVLSILRAIKMVLFPPPGADPVQIWHEASKLLAAGVVVACGVVLEELVARALPGMDLISSVIVSLLTGLATAVVMYGLDRLDLFGAISGQRQKSLLAEFDARVAQALKIGADGIGTFAIPVGPPQEI